MIPGHGKLKNKHLWSIFFTVVQFTNVDCIDYYWLTILLQSREIIKSSTQKFGSSLVIG